MSAPDLSVDSSGHDEAREDVAHHHQQQQQQRGMASAPVSLDGIAPELRSIDASGSRRGSLQASPAGSPLLQHNGSVSSNTSSGGAFSPIMGSAPQQPSVNKLSNGGQLESHGRPGQHYSSYEQTAFYPPPTQQGFARPPPPPSSRLAHPSHQNGYAPPPLPGHYHQNGGAKGNGYPSQPASLPPLSLPSLGNGASSSASASPSYHHLSPNHSYQQQHPHPHQQPPHRTYASYPAPQIHDRNGDVPVQHLPSIQGGAHPSYAGRESWQGGHQQPHYGYGRESASTSSMGDGRKRGRMDGDGGIPVREIDSGEEGGSGGEGSAGRGRDPEWSEGEGGDLEQQYQATKRARMLETQLETQREQQRGIDDILTSAVANSMPTTHRPPVHQPPAPRQANQAAKPPPEKKFVCPHTGCNRAFARNFNLQSHIKSHMGVRDFSCPECSKKFSRKHDCARHCIAIHGYDKETGQPPEHLLAAREEREREQAHRERRERREQAMREDLRVGDGQMGLPLGREMGPP